MLHKVVFWITCLLLVSTGAMAAPRASIRDGNQTGIVSKEMSIPLSGACLAFDASELQRVAVPFRLVLGSPVTDNETDVTGAYRFEATGKPRNRSRDILVSQNHAAIVGSSTRSDKGFGRAAGLRKDANPVARHIPTNIRLRQAQPAAPPVNCEQALTPRLA